MKSSKKQFNAIVVSNVKLYKAGGESTEPDVQGNYPVQLSVIAGQLPQRGIVLNGTIAKNLGIVLGTTQIVQCNYKDTNSYGDNWNHVVLGQLTALELATGLNQFETSMGKAQVVEFVESKVESGIGAVNGEE